MTDTADHCSFCDLIKGSAEVSVCYEDGESIAFMDPQPVNVGHVVVLPREHRPSLLDVPVEVGTHLFQVTMRLAGAIRKVTQCDDVNIVVNGGIASGEPQPHYHVHVIPRRAGDGFSVGLPFAGSSMPDRTVLDATAVQLIAAMRDPMKSGIPDFAAARREAQNAPTVEIAARDFAAMAAATGEVPDGAGRPSPKIVPIEREVVVQVAREGVSSGDPNRLGAWHLEEGAHGELIYDIRDRV